MFCLNLTITCFFVFMHVRGQSIKKPSFFFNLLHYLQLNQTCHLQSTPLHSWYTAPVFSISGTCFVGWPEGPVSNFLLSPLPSEIGDLLVRVSTSGTSPQGPNLESFQSELGGTNFVLLLPHLHGQFFDESQQALSQHDRRPLTWKSIQIWGHLWWTFCLIWNACATLDIAYGWNNPLHKPVATSEKSP